MSYKANGVRAMSYAMGSDNEKGRRAVYEDGCDRESLGAHVISDRSIPMDMNPRATNLQMGPPHWFDDVNLAESVSAHSWQCVRDTPNGTAAKHRSGLFYC